MGFFRGPNIVRDGLVFCIDPGSTRSYVGSGTSIKDLVNRTTCTITSGNYSSSYGGILESSADSGVYFNINVPDSTWMNGAFNKTSGGWTIIEWLRVDDTTYPEAAAGGYGSGGGYGSTTTFGFDWNHGTGNLSTIRFGGSAGTNVNPSSTGYDFDVTVSLSTYPSYGSYFCRQMYWDRTNNLVGAYINGISAGSTSISSVAGYTLHDGGDISFGTLYGWQHDGARGPIMIYNKVLSADEMLQNFTAHRRRFGL